MDESLSCFHQSILLSVVSLSASAVEGAMSSWKIALVVLHALLGIAEAGMSTDTIANHCRRISHAYEFLNHEIREVFLHLTATLKDQKVYINGGLATFADISTSGKIDATTATLGSSMSTCPMDYSQYTD